MIRAKPHTSRDHTTVVIDCWRGRYCSRVELSCAFCSSGSKPDLCESPSGLTTSFLPSSPPSFFPSGLLRLHCMPSTFSPAPLSPESLENPSDQRWVSQKAFRLWCCPLASRLLILAISPDNLSPTSHRAEPSSAETTHFHYWDTVTNTNHKEPLHMLQLILKFRALITHPQNQPELQPPFCRRPPWWLFIILTTTAT